MALAEFIRWRDLTCRWPGCDAAVFDIDHTAPYPAGPTHPSNLKGYCRAHHLVKTFVAGPGGWSERQSPDGTTTFTAPTGHEYVTEPAGASLFPALSIPTGTLNIPADAGSAGVDRGLAMPTRRRTRDEDRRARIDLERRIRSEINSERARAYGDPDPPPF